MSKYSAVVPQMPEYTGEPEFVGGVIVGYPIQPEIPVQFNNKNRRRLFWICLCVLTVILTVALLIYAFTVAR